MENTLPKINKTNAPFIIDKSLTTNLIAMAIIVLGYYGPVYGKHIQSIGYFALSGAITNWLAIYMLFEKVPLLYGSGVIPNRFEEFKEGIKDLVMNQFFTKENIDNFFKSNNENLKLNTDIILDAIDYDTLFEKLVLTIEQSPLGGMLSMFGGANALGPIKNSFIEKMKEGIIEIFNTDKFQQAIAESGSAMGAKSILEKVEQIVQLRLNELTPQIVKQIIQDMIKKHLGWLVVWGGVFGGIIGLFMSLSKAL